MRANLFDPAEWSAVVGGASITLPDAGLRRVQVDLIAERASLFLGFVVDPDEGEVGEVLVWSGTGRANLTLSVSGAAEVIVRQDDDAAMAIRIPELRDLSVEWRRTPSFADLEPPKPRTVSPEVQAVMDRMNQNAIRREMLLLQALENRMKPAN